MTSVIIGMEVRKLGGIDDDSPYRMIVDAWDGEKIVRYEVTGHYEGFPRERTIADVAQGTGCAGLPAAEKLDALDREAIQKLEPIMRELMREQIRVLHGDEMAERWEQSVA